MEQVYCDLCGSTNHEVLWDKTSREQCGILRSVVVRDGEGNILNGRNVICKDCGLVYISPRISREELDRFYEHDYRQIYKTSDNTDIEQQHAQHAYQLLQEERLLVGKLLDVGCSTGQLVKLVKQTDNCTAYGIEPNREHWELCWQQELDVANTTIEVYEPGFKFDCITMLNALEHVCSPMAVLNKLHGLLNDGGYLLVSVPDLLNRTIHTSPDAFLSNVHLYSFNHDTLMAYFIKCGFQPIKTWSTVERIGEKVYALGKKVDFKRLILPPFDGEKLKFVRDHLELADLVYVAKCAMRQFGFK